MEPVLQSRLFGAPWIDPAFRRLPGMQPDAPDGWAFLDDAFAGQMARRDALIAERRDEVVALTEAGRAAAAELLGAVLDRAASLPGFDIGPDAVRRPDGVTVAVRSEDPMATIGRILQEDFCILRSDGGEPGRSESVMTAAVLCFPAQWRLSQKIGRPLSGIHAPVAAYDPVVGSRVQRLFDALKPGRPLWRANLHFQRDAELFTPRLETEPKNAAPPDAPFVRTERQVIFRLPVTGAVVFSIHTQIIRREGLRPEEVRALRDWKGAG